MISFSVHKLSAYGLVHKDVSAYNLDPRAAPGVLSSKQCPVTPTETMTLRMCGRRSMTEEVIHKCNAVRHLVFCHMYLVYVL
jgi:hypothetical protein